MQIQKIQIEKQNKIFHNKQQKEENLLEKHFNE